MPKLRIINDFSTLILIFHHFCEQNSACCSGLEVTFKQTAQRGVSWASGQNFGRWSPRFPQLKQFPSFNWRCVRGTRATTFSRNNRFRDFGLIHVCMCFKILCRSFVTNALHWPHPNPIFDSSNSVRQCGHCADVISGSSGRLAPLAAWMLVIVNVAGRSLNDNFWM